AMYGPLCSVPPIGMMTVVLPAWICARNSVQVRSCNCTVVGVCAKPVCATANSTANAQARFSSREGMEIPCEGPDQPILLFDDAGTVVPIFPAYRIASAAPGRHASRPAAPEPGRQRRVAPGTRGSCAPQ